MYVDFATATYQVTVTWHDGTTQTIPCRSKLAAVRRYNRIVRGCQWLSVEWSAVNV